MQFLKLALIFKRKYKTSKIFILGSGGLGSTPESSGTGIYSLPLLGCHKDDPNLHGSVFQKKRQIKQMEEKWSEIRSLEFERWYGIDMGNALMHRLPGSIRACLCSLHIRLNPTQLNIPNSWQRKKAFRLSNMHQARVKSPNGKQQQQPEVYSLWWRSSLNISVDTKGILW